VQLQTITFFSVSGNSGYADETFANGEGMDSWCSNQQPIPIPVFGSYSQPACNALSCWKVEALNSNLFSMPIHMCAANYTGSLSFKMHFVCNWFGPHRIINNCFCPWNVISVELFHQNWSLIEVFRCWIKIVLPTFKFIRVSQFFMLKELEGMIFNNSWQAT